MPDEKAENTAVDETANFETTSSDMPEVVAEESPEAEQNKASEAEDEAKPEDKTDLKDDIGDDTAASDEAKPEVKGKRRSTQKRINEVVKQREDAKRRAEKAEARILELESASKDESKKDEGDKGKPVESDFDSYDEYLTAVDEHDSAQKDPEPEKAAEDTKPKDSEPGSLTDDQKTAMAVIQEKLADNTEEYKDFDEVALNPEINITGEMLEALAECDDPKKVMYHLGNNADLAANIAGKTAAQQMREIAKLDLTVDIKPKKPTQTTKTAAPISPVSGSDAQEKPISEMSFSEYERKMNKQERERFG